MILKTVKMNIKIMTILKKVKTVTKIMKTLMKVKIPMAIPAIMIGVNQGIMMALAMEVITPLIGGKGLGLEVFTGMSTASIGVSLQAGIGIVLLAIILDRISQAWTRTQREAMGLS